MIFVVCVHWESLKDILKLVVILSFWRLVLVLHGKLNYTQTPHGFLMWEFPLCAVITINEQRNCLGLLIGQNLGRQRELDRMLGGRRQSQRDAMESPPESDMPNLCQ